MYIHLLIKIHLDAMPADGCMTKSLIFFLWPFQEKEPNQELK